MGNIMSRIGRLVSWPLRKAVRHELEKYSKEIRWVVRSEIKSERMAQHWIVRNEIMKSQYNIHFADLREASKSSYEYAKSNFKTADSFQDKFDLRRSLIENHEILEGLVLEFGVYRGESIAQLASLLPSKTIHGFDSFEGLPEDWRSGFKKGHFDTKMPDSLPSNVELYGGWFDGSLPKFLVDNEGPVAFLHVDCDLYSSTKTVLDLLRARIQRGTIILFDEYYNYPNWEAGEFKAFQYFIRSNNLNYEYICYNSCQCQVGVVIA